MNDSAPRVIFEKRRITVLHCDIADTGELSTKLAPETYHRFIGSVLDHVRATVYAIRDRAHARYDGTEGDAIVFCFGLPHSDEHDAERAADAALAVREAVRNLETPDGQPVRMHISVATGEAVAPNPPPPGAAPVDVTGLATPLAAGLKHAEVPGEVVIDDRTYLLIRRGYLCNDVRWCEVPGLGSLCVRTLVGPRTVAPQPPAETPFVGRESDLRVLEDAWRRISPSSPQTALLVGSPGIGKSRLVGEFVARMRSTAHRVLKLRCSPMHRHTPFHPIITYFETVLRLPPASLQVARRAEVVSKLRADARLTDAAVSALADLLAPEGTPVPDNAAARRGRAIAAILSALFDGVGPDKRTLILLEDVHWADASTQDVPARAAASRHDTQVMFLLTARAEPEIESIASIADVRVNLTPLTSVQSTMMVLRMDANSHLDSVTVEQIVAKCDGVPLYLEQVLRSLFTDEASEAASAPTGDQMRKRLWRIPLTLRGLLMSRLDRSPVGRQVAQAGSVLGRSFSRKLLVPVAAPFVRDIDLGLSELVALGLIDVTEAPDGEWEYSFHHALIRDVAYESLFRSERRRLHESVARHLLASPDTASDVGPEVIAHHCTEACLWQDALRWWRMAMNAATERAASADAVHHLREALSRAEALDRHWYLAEGELRLRAMMVPPIIAAFGYASDEVARHITEAEPAVARANDLELRFPFVRAQWNFANTRAHYEDACRIAQSCMSSSTPGAATPFAAHAHLMHGVSSLYLGELATSARDLRRAAALYDPESHLQHARECGIDIASAARAYLARTLWLSGQYSEALRLADEAVSIAATSAVPLASVQAAGMKLLVLQCSGDLAATKAWLDAVRPMFERKRQLYWVNLVRVISAWLRAKVSPSPAAVAPLREAVEAYRATHARLGLSFLGLLQAETEEACGLPKVALRTLDGAVRFAEEHRERYYLPAIHGYRARLLEQLGEDRESIAETLRCGLVIAKDMGARAWEHRLGSAA